MGLKVITNTPSPHLPPPSPTLILPHHSLSVNLSVHGVGGGAWQPLPLSLTPSPQTLSVSLPAHFSICSLHRAGRELSFFSSRGNWDSPTPSPYIYRPCKEPRNRFQAWRAGTTTLFDVPARQATQHGGIGSLELILGLVISLKIRARVDQSSTVTITILRR